MAPSINEKSKTRVFLRILANILWAISLMFILVSCDRKDDSKSNTNSQDSGSVLGTCYMSGLSVPPNGTLIVHAHDVKYPTAETGADSVAKDPNGKFAYVTNYDSNNVAAFTIDTSTGALTEVVGSPFPAGKGPCFVTVDPTGKFVYVANSLSNNVSAYKIVTTGALTEVDGSPFVAGTNPQSITIDPSGKFAYVANYGSDNISAFAIDAATGALTPMDESPFESAIGH